MSAFRYNIIIMKPILKIFSRIAMAASLLLAMPSCSMMTEREPDCVTEYKVRFRFDMNMLYADAFSTQVDEVSLYVFTPDGKLVWTGHEQGEALAQEGYMMTLPLPAGTYEMVAWCGKEHPEAKKFALTRSEQPSAPHHLGMFMPREYDGDVAHSTTDLHDLYHGRLADVLLPDSYGTHIVTMPLVKDTNSVRIMLVHLSGKPISQNDFDVKITDCAGNLGHDNAILEDEDVEYRAWITHESISDVVPPTAADSRSAVSALHSFSAEMTTSRLQTCNTPMLTVTRRADGEKIINIPILDYFLLIRREHYRNMSDDEYLDRQDDYSMTFFLNEDDSWYKQVIDILSWRIVLQDYDL